MKLKIFKNRAFILILGFYLIGSAFEAYSLRALNWVNLEIPIENVDDPGASLLLYGGLFEICLKSTMITKNSAAHGLKQRLRELKHKIQGLKK